MHYQTEPSSRHEVRALLSLVFVGLWGAALTVGCGDMASPSTPSPATAARPVTAAAGGQSRIDLCHATGASGYQLITVSVAAEAAHREHGDGRPGENVPGVAGLVFGVDCAPTAAAERVTITFSDLIGNGTPFSAYTESGFSVVPTMADWVVSGYGHPQPAIIFQPAAVPAPPAMVGRITVTSGSALFRFAAVDLYSSVTTIPYVFTGLKDGTTVFNVTATQPNTFGNFVTVPNPESSAAIDELLITLTNAPPASGCCPDNPMGLDNIVLIR